MRTICFLDEAIACGPRGVIHPTDHLEVTGAGIRVFRTEVEGGPLDDPLDAVITAGRPGDPTAARDLAAIDTRGGCRGTLAP
ncbi:MAG: hypothetical protein AAGF73_12840 [Actinomycetota bacterium]